ncbi:unnamed protein product [Mytilus coruscus]|uniref:Mab-21-like HhH/H2TH-like domain-containing protein n=1 Tax=Mytilus coruscus TaxID=42192 RepID=A0A6J8E5T6_MYTCO|nr:unnamed protein product [Mytilus coruscus]
MHNQPELKAVSVRLYKYLCDEIVGSEKVVRYKRLYCKLHDDILTDSETALISSGSKAEGLDLPGSDIDIMLCSKISEVYEDEPKDKEDVIILDTENALPGFALLKVAGESEFPTTNTTDGVLLANSDMLQLALDEKKGDNELFEIHGPSLSNSLLHDIDMVTCFKCHSWPKVAHKWFFRHRPSGWPSQDIISNVVSDGVLVVPIGSRMLRKHLPNSARKMLTVMFLKGNKMILTSIDVLNGKNKCSYLHYKECLSRILINTFYDDVFGWLLLAAYFYSTQEYHKMSQILLFASSELSLNKHRFSGASRVDNRGFVSENYQFLNADFPDIGALGCNQSVALFFFLKFLYSRKQGSSLEIQSALELLKQTVNEKSDTPIHWLSTMSSYDLLHKAFELSNDIEGDETRELEELKAITSSDKFDVFIKWAQNEEDIKLLFELV